VGERARRRPRAAGLALAALTALAGPAALAGCASLPTSGPVRAAAPGGETERREYRVSPVGPVAGAGPLDVVEGFLRAGVGTQDDFAAARSHLVGEHQGLWRPGARIVVHPQGALTLALTQAGVALPDGSPPPDPAAGPVEVEVSAPVTATVDERGTYTPAPPGEVERMRLAMALEDGQWRIASVPDRLVVDVSDFALNWRPRALYFPDSSGTSLVPEVRWLADRPSTPTTAVDELLRGPSAWLAPATRPLGLEGVGLASGGVPVEDGVAQVDLTAAVLDASARTRLLLQRQLVATLTALPGVDSVEVTAEGGTLTGGASAEPPADVPVDPAPVMVANGVLHRWTGATLAPVPRLGPADQVAGPLEAPALLGSSVASLAASRTVLLRWLTGEGGVDAEPVPPAAVLAAPPGTTLTAPSFDPAGWLWSTAAACDGTVTAVGPEGAAVAVAAPWLAGRTVLTLRASREGARVLVASTAPGGADPRVDVAGVARAEDGAPVALTAAAPAPTPWLTSVRAAVWVDPTTAAVLGTTTADGARPGARSGATAATATAQVFLVTGGSVSALGAPGTSQEPAPEPVGLAAGNGTRTLLVAAADGRVFKRAGARWAVVEELAGASGPAYAG
jgi:hypothetical protein